MAVFNSHSHHSNWLTVSAVAVCLGLLAAICLLGLGGQVRFKGDESQRKQVRKLEAIRATSQETLAAVKEATAAVQLADKSKQEVERLRKELVAAKQRVAELEKEAAVAKQRADDVQKQKDEAVGSERKRVEDLQREKDGKLGLIQGELKAAREALERGAAGGGAGGTGAAGPNTLTLKQRSIPRIFHHMWLAEGDGAPIPEQHKAWMESCKLQYKPEAGWEYKLWTMADVKELIKQKKPEYLKTFEAFPKHVMRIDAGKYMVMQHVGGLYVDTDTQCFREGGNLLDGYDLIVQADYAGHAVNSGILASKPGHPVWEEAWKLMEERKDHDPNDTGHSTGPQIVRDMIDRWHNKKPDNNGLFPEEMEKDGMKTKVYPQGTWFTPCGWGSGDCHTAFMLKMAAGQVDLHKLVGFHRFTALWLGWKDGVHPQHESTIRAAICKDFNATVAH